MRNTFRRLAIALLVAMVPSYGWTWGSQGHQIIATIAQSQLTPATRKEVDRLLALEPVATLESVSTWADEHRNPATAAWHYVNMPRGNCVYEAQRDCPDGRCVVEAIQKQADILQSSASDDKKLLALKYLVHFVGDVHQPLHAGYADDRGGNTYQLQAFMRGSNLHAFWDTGLIQNLNEGVGAVAKRLSSTSTPIQLSRPWSAAQAAQESCKIVSTDGFYPERLVGMDYIRKYTPVMESRLRISGDRLAELLNRTLK
jgi:nuclease S1